jgi:transposase InsO family protein
LVEVSNLLPADIFYTLKEAQVLIEEWLLEYNPFRQHSSLNPPPATGGISALKINKFAEI